jgi:hypothetical protein
MHLVINQAAMVVLVQFGIEPITLAVAVVLVTGTAELLRAALEELAAGAGVLHRLEPLPFRPPPLEPPILEVAVERV